MEDGFVPVYYNQKAAKVRKILSAIALPIMVITVILQFFWFNIVLHTVLCSAIIALYIGRLVCDVIQRDGKDGFYSGSLLLIWTANIVLNLLTHFI